MHGSIGSFPEEKRVKYAEIIDSFTKPGGRMLLSVFDYDHSEHPPVPFEKEVATLYKDNFSLPKLLQEIDANRTGELFQSRDAIWTFSWKILFLVKH